MTNKLLDVDLILRENEQWTKLDEEWGNPVDLDVEEDIPAMQSRFSSLDLRKTTFDSSFLFKKVRRKVGRQLSKRSANLNYDDFLNDLKKLEKKEKKEKYFYFINGQIISAVSVEEICDTIDNVFSSIEKLCSATSTVRKKIPNKIECSISTEDLSFDDSTISEKMPETYQSSDGENIDRYIDDAFDQLSCTIRNLSNDELDDATRESVTTLVKRFSLILNNSNIKRSPRRQECCNRFRELADFWNNHAFGDRNQS